MAKEISSELLNTILTREMCIRDRYRKSMAAVTPPAAIMMNGRPRNCSKSSPYKKLMTGMPIHPLSLIHI